MPTTAPKIRRIAAKYIQLVKSMPINPIFSNETTKTPPNAEKIVKLKPIRFFLVLFSCLHILDKY